MSFITLFKIGKKAPGQSRIDRFKASKRVTFAMLGCYGLGLIAIGVSTHLAHQHQPDAGVVPLGGFFAGLVVVVFFVHLIGALQELDSLNPVRGDGLRELAELFKSDVLAPAILRYRQEVIDQGREFCVAEAQALESYQRNWEEDCREDLLRQSVYSAGKGGIH